MILTKEDYNGLVQVLAILNRIVKNAVMSELEEEHERRFNKTIDSLGLKSAFNLILKELKKMSQKFKEIFNEEWFQNHLRRKTNGIYELRCSIDKVPYSGAGKTPEIAAENFIKDMASRGKKEKSAKPAVPKASFNDFTEKWFKLVKSVTVKSNTYRNYYSVYSAHIKPFFKGKFVSDMTAMQIQPLFTALLKQKKKKIAKDAYTILNQIFKSAVGERLLPANPMNEVKLLKYRSETGVPLTYEEELDFINECDCHVYKIAFLVLLYGGMRRGELSSARLENGFILVDCNKLRLDQPSKVRKVPVTPMLKKHLEGITKTQFKKAVNITPDVLTRAFKKICPNHHLHELRHTFITRCQECGVPREVVSVWAGHAADKTMTSTVYTHFSDEFMLSEGKKVDYFSQLYNSK